MRLVPPGISSHRTAEQCRLCGNGSLLTELVHRWAYWSGNCGFIGKSVIKSGLRADSVFTQTLIRTKNETYSWSSSSSNLSSWNSDPSSASAISVKICSCFRSEVRISVESTSWSTVNVSSLAARWYQSRFSKCSLLNQRMPLYSLISDTGYRGLVNPFFNQNFALTSGANGCRSVISVWITCTAFQDSYSVSQVDAEFGWQGWLLFSLSNLWIKLQSFYLVTGTSKITQECQIINVLSSRVVFDLIY